MLRRTSAGGTDDLLGQENPARFFRKMALYMKNAIPIFNRPPEIRQWLELDMTLPSWDEASWVSTGESAMEETQVATEMPAPEPSPEERIAALEKDNAELREAMEALLSGVTA